MSNNVPAARYPYIHAYGDYMGSFPYYMRDQAAMAAEDAMPDTVYRQDTWDTLTTPTQRDKAMDAVNNGTALLVRDQGGTPKRVWYLPDHIRNEEMRAHLDRRVDEIRTAHA